MDGETAPAAKLPPELWVEILAKLPAIDLVRFRCVSKAWCSIIDDPSFIYMHFHKFEDNLDKSLFLFWESRYFDDLEAELRIRVRLSVDLFRSGLEIMSVNYPRSLLDFEPVSYANGLLLFCMYRMDTVTNSSDECDRLSSDPCCQIYLDLYLFNPSIRKFLMLSPLPSYPDRREMLFSGFDPVGNDHKVVAVVVPLQVSQVTPTGFIVVYELSTRCWRVNSSSRIQVQDPTSMKKGVYAKGVMHWIYCDSSLVPKPTNCTHVVSFNFASEEFSYSSLPGDRDDDCEILTFPFVLGDSFAILDITSTITCIWVLSRCGDNGRDTWSNWYTGPPDLDNYRFFLKHKDDIDHVMYVDKISKFLLSVSSKAKVMLYDIETHMMDPFMSQCVCVMEPYVESLLLSKGIGSPFLDLPQPQGPEGEINMDQCVIRDC